MIGRYRWSKIIGGSSDSDFAVAVKLDKQSGVYVSGMMSMGLSSGVSATSIGGDTVIGSTNKRIFLAKWDTSGNFQWIRFPEPETISYPVARIKDFLSDMDFDGQNMCLLAGLGNGLYGGSQSIAADGTYVLKYSTTGVLQAMVPISLTYMFNNVQGLFRTGMSYNSKTKQFVLSGETFTCYFIGITKIDTIPIQNLVGSVAGFDASTGALRFLTKQTRGDFNDGIMVKRVAFDDSGAIYAAGWYQDSIEIEGRKLYNGYYRPQPGVFPMAPIYMKLDGLTGSIIWLQDGHGRGNVDPTPPTRVGSRLFTAGNFTMGILFGNDSIRNGSYAKSDAFLLELDPATGNFLQLDSVVATTGSVHFFNQIQSVGDYSFLLPGNLSDSLSLGGISVSSTTGGNTSFISKFGYPDCRHCSPDAVAMFESTYLSGTSFQYRYTGTIVNVDSLRWVWGDGKQQTVKKDFTRKITHSFPGNGAFGVCVTVYFDSCTSLQYCATSKLAVAGAAIRELRVYPNPSTGIFQLDNLQRGDRIIVENLYGQLVLEQEMNQSSFSLAGYPAGSYILRLRHRDGRQEVMKLLKL